MRFLNADFHSGGKQVASGEEDGGAQNQDRRVDEERRVERNRRIDEVVAAGLPFTCQVRADPPRLHECGMQIQIVRHHRRAQNADGQKKRGFDVSVAIKRQTRFKSGGDRADIGRAKNSWIKKRADGRDQTENDRLHLPHPQALHP